MLPCHRTRRAQKSFTIAVGKKFMGYHLSFYFMGRCLFARRMENMYPDLRGVGLPHVLLFYGNFVRVFSGNSWTWMDCVPFSATRYNGFTFILIRGDSNAVGFLGYSLK
jgi:hypothetical protein